MASQTLLQLLSLSIIFTKQIDARSINKTNNVESLTCNLSDPTGNKCSVKTDENDRNDTVLTKKTYTDYDQRSGKNLESKYDDNLTRNNKYDLKSNHIDNAEADYEKSHGQQDSAENIKPDTPLTVTTRKELTSSNRKQTQNTAIDKNKRESQTELEPHEGSSSQNDAEKNKEAVHREKHILAVRRHEKKTRTTKAIRDGWTTEIDDSENDILSKTKHCDCKNHGSFEKISRENDIYRLKRRDETKPESKHSNKSKSRDNKSFRTLKRLPIPETVYKSKLSEQSDTISKENEIYKLEHLNDIVSVEQVKNPEYKPKLSHNFQRKKHRENTIKNVIDNVKHTSKTKHDFDEAISYKHNNKLTLNGHRDTHTNIRDGKYSVSSEDTLKAAEAEAHTSDCDHEEQKTLNSSENQFNENDLNQPKLPFYVSSKIPKDTNKQEMLLDHLNTLLKGSSNVNETIDRLASSKILDFITDRMAGHMLKKLQNNQAFKNQFTTTHKEGEKVEQIDILFKNDGDMVIMNREKGKYNTYIPDL